MTPDALITELDSLAAHMRTVAWKMVADRTHPDANELADRAIELYGAAGMIDEWIAELAEEAA